MPVKSDVRDVEDLADCVRLVKSLIKMGLGDRKCACYTIAEWLDVLNDPNSGDLLLRSGIGSVAGFTQRYLCSLLGDASDCVAVQIVYMTDLKKPS